MRRPELRRFPGCGGRFKALAVLVLGLLLASSAYGRDRYRVVLGDGGPLLSREPQPTITGSTEAPEGTRVEVSVDPVGEDVQAVPGETPSPAVTTVGSGGAFALTWPWELAGGSYTVTVVLSAEGVPVGRGEATLVVQPEGRLPRRPLIAEAEPPVPPEAPRTEDFQAFTDRWRLVPPAYELTTPSRGWWDPYHQNRLKGDVPIRGQNLFLVLTGVADSLVDAARLPTPSGVSADRPGSIGFFGERGQLFGNQLLLLSADLFRGDTAFRPIDWRVKATVAASFNHLAVRENAVVRPDVRDGTTRSRGFGALEELFFERKIADLSPHFDFLSVRAGIQPFSSDFRGFIFSDINLGVRLFGNLGSNRNQFNLAFFERLEKDTNSGLNTFELRDARVLIANYYRQDFLVKGYTAQVSLHLLQDDATFVFDKNGFLVRPDPIGSFTPHEIEVVYLGWTGFGHVGRINLDHALYWVVGDDSLNPIAGPDPDLLRGDDAVDVSAVLAALEISIDRNWWRPKLSLLWATGDDDPTDRTARGFDAIFDNPAFAGGGFSFWNRLGIRLAGTGVGLVQRGSFLPSLKSSKEEGQPNFVNPGLQLVGLGVDLELTPELKVTAQINHLRFDTTAPLELVLFQGGIGRGIGTEVAVGARWRPWLHNQVILTGGVAAFLPGDGFEAIYEDGSTLVAGFAGLKVAF